MSKLLLIGGGGHCRVVADSIYSLDAYEELGIVDWTDSSCFGIPVVGNDDDLPVLLREGWTDAFITVGSIGNTAIRRRLFRMASQLGFHMPAVADPTAVIARNVEIHDGAYIGKRTVVNPGSTIGVCTIINTGAIVEHDCLVGDFAHVSPGAVLCGQVQVGTDVHVGAGSVVRQQLVIGAGSLIGAGSVVTKDIPVGATAWGNPCKVVRT